MSRARHCEWTTRTGHRCLNPEAYLHSPFCYVHGQSATELQKGEAWRVRLAREHKCAEENRRKEEADERRRLALPELLRAARTMVSAAANEYSNTRTIREQADLENALLAFE